MPKKHKRYDLVWIGPQLAIKVKGKRNPLKITKHKEMLSKPKGKAGILTYWKLGFEESKLRYISMQRIKPILEELKARKDL